jgi:hypothetical protein
MEFLAEIFLTNIRSFWILQKSSGPLNVAGIAALNAMIKVAFSKFQHKYHGLKGY